MQRHLDCGGDGNVENKHDCTLHLHIAAGRGARVGRWEGDVFTEHKQSDGEDITEGKSSTGGRIKGKRRGRGQQRKEWKEDEEK